MECHDLYRLFGHHISLGVTLVYHYHIGWNMTKFLDEKRDDGSREEPIQSLCGILGIFDD